VKPVEQIIAETRSWIAKVVVVGGLVAWLWYGAYCARTGDSAGLRTWAGTGGAALLAVMWHYFPRRR
jgi:hypothetical protein